MKKCRSCSLPDRRLLPAKGKLPMCKSTSFYWDSAAMSCWRRPIRWHGNLRFDVVNLCLRIGRALFMPCLYLLYALFIPSLCLVYTLFMPSMWVWCDMRSSHVMPTLACAMACIYGCGISWSSILIIKTRHCILGCSRAVPSGLWLDALSSSASCRRWWVVSEGDEHKWIF